MIKSKIKIGIAYALGAGLPTPPELRLSVHIKMWANRISISHDGHCQTQPKAAIVNTSLASDAYFIPPGCKSRSDADR
jgi:hypothetical protein